MFSAVNPKYFNRSSAFPDLPNVSLIPSFISLAGYSEIKTSAIAVPSPPITL